MWTSLALLVLGNYFTLENICRNLKIKYEFQLVLPLAPAVSTKNTNKNIIIKNSKTANVPQDGTADMNINITLTLVHLLQSPIWQTNMLVSSNVLTLPFVHVVNMSQLVVFTSQSMLNIMVSSPLQINMNQNTKT